MAQIIKIRASIFIPEIWLSAGKDSKTGFEVEYEGDNREFSPHTVNSMRSRIEQEVVVDFIKKGVFSFSNTGISRAKIIKPDKSVDFETGKASTEKILCKEIVWSPNSVSFIMLASAKNPLRDAPTVDYELKIKCLDNGLIEVDGWHDGFPCFEFYKQVDFKDFQTIYTHDYRKTGDTSESMAGPMKYQFKKELK